MSGRHFRPQKRPQELVLADLDIRIAWAEKVRDHYHDFMGRVVATNQSPRAARMRLKLAEERLAQLYRSREVLLSGEGQEGDGQALAPR